MIDPALWEIICQFLYGLLAIAATGALILFIAWLLGADV